MARPLPCPRSGVAVTWFVCAAARCQPRQLAANMLPISRMQTHHPGWRHILWQHDMCEQLLRDRYPWFLDTWRSYGSVVLKSGGHASCCRHGAPSADAACPEHRPPQRPRTPPPPKPTQPRVLPCAVPLQTPSAPSSCTPMAACTWTWTRSASRPWTPAWRALTWRAPHFVGSSCFVLWGGRIGASSLARAGSLWCTARRHHRPRLAPFCSSRDPVGVFRPVPGVRRCSWRRSRPW